jgi:hypothetical protein
LQKETAILLYPTSDLDTGISLVWGNIPVFQGIISKDEVEPLTLVVTNIAHSEVAFACVVSDGGILGV